MQNIKVSYIINTYEASCFENLSGEVLRDVFLAIPENITNLFKDRQR